jgi:hypothetical protein
MPLAVENAHGQRRNALYAIGPGIDENEPAERRRRKDHLVDGECAFEEKGKSTRASSHGPMVGARNLDLARRRDLDASAPLDGGRGRRSITTNNASRDLAF